MVDAMDQDRKPTPLDQTRPGSAPTESQLEQLLGQISPKPSPGFHTRMGAQAWRRRTRQTRLRLAISTIALFSVVVISLSLSPVQAFGQRLLQFFVMAPTQEIDLSAHLADLVDPQAAFNLSLGEAETLAGFQAYLPTELPTDFSLQGAAYRPSRRALVLNYTNLQGDTLRIAQRLAGPELQNIAPNANVESVQIGKYVGEYVTGAWTLPEVKSTPAPEDNIPVQASWDPDARLQILRWQTEEMLFEIIAAANPAEMSVPMSLTDLIDLAASMRSQQ